MERDTGTREQEPTLLIKECIEIAIQNDHRQYSRRRKQQKFDAERTQRHQRTGEEK